ncbi:MAG TPA: hypothetical protein VGY66_26205 [Gemmataceae bacterium]|jgi:hypothetical protein|nr:hypothetical protein [Gemmataceae bacterium]
MPIYFMLLDARQFHQDIIPALSVSWRQRSFAPCSDLCRCLLPAAQTFEEKFHVLAGQTIIAKVVQGLPFDRDRWKLLVGEILLFAAAEVPEIEVVPETMLCLVAPDAYLDETGERRNFPPIQQAHAGARDLDFGGKVYRPEKAGYNDTPDVDRLASYLGAQEPERWTVSDLKGLRGVSDDAERADELAFAREWFPALRELYQQAQANRHVVVCEVL